MSKQIMIGMQYVIRSGKVEQAKYNIFPMFSELEGVHLDTRLYFYRNSSDIARRSQRVCQR